MFNIGEFPASSLASMVAALLNSVMKTNDPLGNFHITYFHSRSVPHITIESYLTRILQYAPYSNEALLSVLVYLDRIAELQKNQFVINSFNIHRLLITGIVIASKLTSDVFYPNARYAKVGGVSLHELNRLELEFLFLCNFDLHVRLEDLQTYGNQLLHHALKKQRLEVGRKRCRTYFPTSPVALSPPENASDDSDTDTIVIHPTKKNRPIPLGFDFRPEALVKDS